MNSKAGAGALLESAAGAAATFLATHLRPSSHRSAAALSALRVPVLE